MNKLVIVAMLCVAPYAFATSARERVQREFPNMRWHRVQRTDLDCDGKRDEVFTGRRDDRFYVAVVTRSSVSGTSFALAGDSQDSFCGPPRSIVKERLDYDPSEMLGETPAGFRRSAGCFGLVIDTGDCDPFHLYWDFQAKALAWWRL